MDVFRRAAERGNLEAVQLLAGHRLAQHEGPASIPDDVLSLAIASGSVPTARFLRQAGCAFSPSALSFASTVGDLPMVKWLTEAGCPVTWEHVRNAPHLWPRDSAEDGKGLLEAIRLLAEAAPSVGSVGCLWSRAVEAGHPWAVLQGLLQYKGRVPWPAVSLAAAAGCEATLRASAAMDICTECRPVLCLNWYADAAKYGDLGTLVYLQRLGLPLGEGAVGLAVSGGAPLPALRWLTEHGAPWSHGELRGKLSLLAAAYPSPRDRERKDVEAWLRGLLSGREAAAAAGGLGTAVGEQLLGQGAGGAAGCQPVAALGDALTVQGAVLVCMMAHIPLSVPVALVREYVRGSVWALLAAHLAGYFWVVAVMLSVSSETETLRERDYENLCALVVGPIAPVIVITATADYWWPHIWGTLAAAWRCWLDLCGK